MCGDVDKTYFSLTMGIHCCLLETYWKQRWVHRCCLRHAMWLALQACSIIAKLCVMSIKTLFFHRYFLTNQMGNIDPLQSNLYIKPLITKSNPYMTRYIIAIVKVFPYTCYDQIGPQLTCSLGKDVKNLEPHLCPFTVWLVLEYTVNMEVLYYILHSYFVIPSNNLIVMKCDCDCLQRVHQFTRKLVNMNHGNLSLFQVAHVNGTCFFSPLVCNTIQLAITFSDFK